MRPKETPIVSANGSEDGVSVVRYPQTTSLCAIRKQRRCQCAPSANIVELEVIERIRKQSSLVVRHPQTTSLCAIRKQRRRAPSANNVSDEAKGNVK